MHFDADYCYSNKPADKMFEHSHDAPGNGKLAGQHGCWCKLEMRIAYLAPEAVQQPSAQSLSPAPGKGHYQELWHQADCALDRLQ